MITQNLFAALQRLRSPEKDRTLWVDSVCINQLNVPEKNQQVKLMTRIYRTAATVLIWLGSDDENGEDTAKAFDCIQLLRERVVPRLDELRQWEDKALVKADKGRNDTIAKYFDIPTADSIEFVALNKLLRRPWWYRAWTFQESFVSRSRQIYCGCHQVTGEDMLDVTRALFNLSNCTKDPRYLHADLAHLAPMTSGERFWSDADIGRPADEQLSLSMLLMERRGSGCKLPQDLVYSLLGAARDRLDLAPDYAVPFETVFAKATAQIISITGSLSILREVYGEIECSGLPTWVPDWRRTSASRGHYNRYLPFTSFVEQRYSCTGSSRPRMQLSADTTELTLEGLKWDVVASVKTGSMGDVYESVESHPWKGPVYRPTDELRSIAFQRLLCTDRALFSSQMLKPRWNAESYGAIPSPDKNSFASKVYMDELMNNTWGKAVAITQSSFLALVPDWAKPGDTICWMLGGEVPLIIRRDSADGKYTFVGQGYVHGYMDGEVLLEARDLMDWDYDGVDKSWLTRLHEEPLPSAIMLSEFTIK